MAKFNMKDYDEFLKEEEKQARLQKELEYQREEEAIEANANWRDWQEDQKSKEYEEYYEDDNCYYPECEDDYYGPEYAPWELLDEDDCCYEEDYWADANWKDDDLYDYYFDDFGTEDFYPDPEMEDPWEDELDPNLTAQDDDLAIWLNILDRKSVARNRHLNEEKAKKRAKKSASMLMRKCLRGDFRLPYEEYRLVTRATAASKKANRFKFA